MPFRSHQTARDSLAFLLFKMKKILSVFVDESGDTGFENGASKYYVVSLVFHEQNNDISSQLNKFKSDPVFHVGPIIRKEDEFKKYEYIGEKEIFE